MKLTLEHISTRNSFIVIATLLFALLYIAALSYVRGLETKVHALAVELANEASREASLRDMSGFVEDVSADARTLSSFFVTPDAAVDVIEEVEGLGAMLGTKVTISGVRIENEDEVTGEGTMVMEVAADGSWNTMMTLARLLDAYPYASRIDAMSVRRTAGSESGTSSWALRATMQLMLRQ